jgi:tetratricopeptide (TPR) repeat protein
MDGRTSACLVLGLALGTSGCVTTHEKQTNVAFESQLPPTAAKELPKKPAPPRLMLSIAEVKEREAEAAKLTPDIQAQLRDETRRIYQEVLKAEPDNLDAARGLARVYTQMGDFDRAQEVYQKALTKHPRDVMLWHDVAMMHNRRKNWPEGMRCLNKALEIDPENQRCLKTLGFTLARTGQIEQSLTCLTRAMGSAASAHYHVALMLLHVGEHERQASRPQLEEQARIHLQLALRQNPQLETARELLARLDTPARTGTAAIQFSDSR